MRCPFHGWQFGAEDGKCVKIPYCDEIPERAQLRTWHVEEKNGEVYIWFHPENTGPQWGLPDLPELGDPNWTAPRYTELLVPAHVQDICENSCDPVHFQYVHKQMDVPPSTVTIDDDGRTMHLNSECRTPIIPVTPARHHLQPRFRHGAQHLWPQCGNDHVQQRPAHQPQRDADALDADSCAVRSRMRRVMM